MGYGYPAWGFGSNWMNAGLGYGGWGWGGGYGNGYYGGYGGAYGGGYGGSYGYDPYCTTNVANFGDYYYTPASGSGYAAVDPALIPASAPIASDASSVPVILEGDKPAAAETPAGTSPFAEQGEQEFKEGNYDKAAMAWRHAIVEDPKNGVLLMMLSQALFASGKFDEAAGAAQQGLMLLPQESWGVVPQNFKDLYGNAGDYSQQLKVLEAARKAKPEDPGLRFLLGYHYGFLGYPREAIEELDRGLKLVPQDQLAEKLREEFGKKLLPANAASESPSPVPQKEAK